MNKTQNPYYCPVCEKSHVVPSMVKFHIEKAGGPDRSETLSVGDKPPKS